MISASHVHTKMESLLNTALKGSMSLGENLVPFGIAYENAKKNF
jgi:hypothetical protein